MDRRLSYRRGSPVLKPLPLVTRPVPEELVLPGGYTRTEFFTKIANILHGNNVYYHRGYLARRFHANETDIESQNVTVFIEGNLEKSSVNNWDSAVQEIRLFLNESYLENFFVEILDHQKITTSSFAITKEIYPHHEVDSLYTSVQLYLKDMSLKWTTMTLLYRGTDLSDSHPTLLITALDLEHESWWTEALPKLKERCHEISPILDVELLHGAISYSYGLTDPGPEAVDFGRDLQLGGSIGAQGSDGSGSIGAAVKLRIGQNPSTTFILSNHHVTAQDKDVEGPPYGYTIQSPSDADTAFRRKALNEELADWKNERIGLEEIYGKIINDVEHIPRSVRYIPRAEQHCVDKLRGIPTHDNARNAGILFASKQDVSNGGWILDWSLTKLDDNRSMINEVPAIKGYRRSTTLRSGIDPSEPMEPVTTWMSDACVRGRTVAKRGRSTWWTVGTVNQYETYAMESKKEIRGKAWPIFPNAIANDSIPFFEKGDSGSVIFLTDRDIIPKTERAVMVGLGFGVVDNFCLMSPLSAVFASIEEDINAAVIEPYQLEGGGTSS